ncbi:hypothetical protein ACTXT7_003763 [Hymenolepis weldensis]
MIISYHRYIEIRSIADSNDFATTLFSLSSYNSHPPGKKAHRFVVCPRFGDGLFANIFSPHNRLQRVDDTQRPPSTREIPYPDFESKPRLPSN